jgi:hypothetical protein
MRHASWAGAVLAVVASAGVVWGQAVDSTVTIQQSDGLPEPCRVVKAWTTKDGQSACLLQSLDTDEMLTVVQKGAAAKGNSQVGVGIYRWGNSMVPPDGSPVPPTDSGVKQVCHTTTVPSRHLPDLSWLTSHVTAHPASCPSGGCEKSHCAVVHQYEKPTTVYFRPGECVPVSSPTHAPNYGYYATQWRPFPAGGELPPQLLPGSAP